MRERESALTLMFLSLCLCLTVFACFSTGCDCGIFWSYSLVILTLCILMDPSALIQLTQDSPLYISWGVGL